MNPCPALNCSGCQQYTKDADDCGYEYGNIGRFELGVEVDNGLG